MSHNPERKEKNCLNCDTQVRGRFCHVCGQENIETKESFWSLTKHFVYDILHFDGNFFHTLKYIFTKPGFVARQYAEGKRVSFLHPIRMYLFTSAVFFLVFFSVQSFTINNTYKPGNLDNKDRIELANNLQKRLDENPSNFLLKQGIPLIRDTTHSLNIDSLGLRDSIAQLITFGENKYASVKEYEAVQDTIQEIKKDGWFKRRFIRQSIYLNNKYGNKSEGIQSYVEAFIHKLPYLLFVSLPFFALLLKLLYIRRKNFYYSDHIVFTLYHYILSFILLLLLLAINKLHDITHWGLLTFLLTIIAITWPVYLYLEMKNFYRQGKWKTFGKFLLLNLLGFVLILILFLFILLFSFFQL